MTCVTSVKQRRDKLEENNLEAQLAEAQRQLQLWREECEVLRTLFYEAQEHLCSCNIVDVRKPIGDSYNYVCEWHEKYQRHVVAREPLLTLAKQIEAVERERDAAQQRVQELETVDKWGQQYCCLESTEYEGAEHNSKCNGELFNVNPIESYRELAKTKEHKD